MSAHDIPRDVTVQAFAEAGGPQLPAAGPRADEGDRWTSSFRGRTAISWTSSTSISRFATRSMVWLARKIELYNEDAPVAQPRILSTRVSLESDKSFDTYEHALAHVTGPALTNGTRRSSGSRGSSTSLFEYPIQSDRSHFAIHMAFDRLGISVVTALRFLPPGGVVRPTSSKAMPGSCRSIPAGTRRSLRFVTLGFFHILDGTDHLLFLFCLVIPFRRIWTLVPIVTAFTVAHSITLIAAAYERPGRAVVSAAHRDAHRDVDRLHGDGEHRRRARRGGAG